MFYSLTGKLIHTMSEMAVVECGGVGYACKTTYYTLQKIAGQQQVTLYTYLAVREDAVELFGFSSQEELKCFKMLIAVSKVGPKAALSILSSNTPSQFALAVASGDSKAISKAKGVGEKTAQRIVLELKDKIAKEQGIEKNIGFVNEGGSFSQSSLSEAVAALTVLGYSEAQAHQAVCKIDPTLPVEEIIKKALISLAKF